jgi:hypothetical protein
VRSAPTRLTTREGGDTTGAPERLENPGFTTGMGRYNYNGVKKDGRDQREPGERRSCLPSVVRVGCSDRSVERASRRGRTKEYMYVWYYGYRGSRGLRRGLVGLAGGARGRPRRSLRKRLRHGAGAAARPKLIQPTPKAWSVHVGSFSVVELALL